MEKPKISIISSIYNREKYILRFLRSIQNQYFDEIEIILVNDGSNDNSVKLIKNSQIMDERIILINHYKNRGTFISRNHGVFIAKGEYIILPDPDDILSNNILQNCYELAIKYGFDMIRFNLYLGNNKIFFEDLVNELNSRPIHQPELSSYLFYGNKNLQQIDFNVANKFIKREIYIKAINSLNNFFLNQYMINHEDGIINYILYRTANSFFFFKKIGYYYLPNEQSITLTFNKNYDDTIKYIFLHLKFVFENTKNNKHEKNMTNCLFGRLYNGVLSECINLITKNYSFFIDIINQYLKCIYISSDNIAKLNKLKSIILEKQKINQFA
jgi:glycosyltransferase involved in cell wall biosynthesis